MADIYTDENVHSEIIRYLRSFGHNVLTTLEDGKANQEIEDSDVLTRATELRRVVVTNNRDDFHHLHQDTGGAHAGIITYTMDLNDIEGVARRIHMKLEEYPDMRGKCERVTKENRRKKKKS